MEFLPWAASYRSVGLCNSNEEYICQSGELNSREVFLLNNPTSLCNNDYGQFIYVPSSLNHKQQAIALLYLYTIGKNGFELRKETGMKRWHRDETGVSFELRRGNDMKGKHV
jgi:hypothetical protein